MRFWDSSAVAPLVYEEEETALREKQLREDSQLVVWYGTWVELESAVARRTREGGLAPDQAALARAKIGVLARSWMEVEPTPEVRERAVRLLRVHVLRAGDAFQLAAALVLAGERPRGHFFLTADTRLSAAAEAEGFAVR